MNFIDVTLRDGGHQVDFDWNEAFLSKYLPVVSSVKEVSYIELGYWLQTSKSLNRFYNMSPSDLEWLVDLGLKKPASVMIDYHYCSHDISDYKSEAFSSNVDLIRLCSRREDITEAVKFGRKLIDELGVKLSLNFFNITNYSSDEIRYCVENGKRAGATFLYFADTHGALNLNEDATIYAEYAKMINDSGIIAGLHLHDHSGKAYLNYCLGKKIGFSSFDFSLGGMGKGVGNLKMEHIVSTLDNLDLIDLLNNESLLRMPPLVSGLITAALSSTDYYATKCDELGIAPSQLARVLMDKTSSERDIFDASLLTGSKK